MNLEAAVLSFLSKLTYTNIASLASILGLMISIFTLRKVQSIISAKKEEREILASALDLEGINEALNHINSLVSQSSIGRSLEQQLITLQSKLEASMRIMLPSITSDIANIRGIEAVAEGYFTDKFVIDRIAEAKKELVFFSWRNTRVLSEASLDAILQQCIKYKKLKIKIYAMCPEAPDSHWNHLKDHLKLVDIDQDREKQKQSLEFAKSIFKEKLQNNTIHRNISDRFHYYHFKSIPSQHIVKVDDNLYWGINFYARSELGATDHFGKAYLKATIKSGFGKKLNEQLGIIDILSEKANMFS